MPPRSPSARRTGRALIALVAAAGVLFGTPTARAEPEDQASLEGVLVAGDPPLTRDTVENCRRFLEWVLDAPVTDAQATELQDSLVQTWRAGDREGMQGTLALLELREKVSALPEAQRDFLRAQALPQLLAEWRSKPEDPFARWSLAVHDAAHAPIAEGNPPLTRQMSDAYAEALVFAAREATGRPFEADAAFRDLVAKRLADAYAGLAPEARRLLAACPLAWAALRVAWPELPAPEKEALKKKWIAAFGVVPAPDPSTQAAERALAELESLGRRGTAAPLTPVEMRQAANRMEIVAEHLRHLEGARNVRTADDLERTARAWRTAAADAEASSAGGAGSSAYEAALALQRRQHQAFVALSNASLTTHVGTMNMISIMSGSPYRYSVR